MLVRDGLPEFSKIESARSPVGALFYGRTSIKRSENHLIPAPEPVKSYRATSVPIVPTRPLATLIENGFVEFLRIELARSLAGAPFYGRIPTKSSEYYLILALKLVKCYRAISVATSPIQTLFTLVRDRLVEFLRIESARSPVGALFCGRTPTKSSKNSLISSPELAKCYWVISVASSPTQILLSSLGLGW